MKRKTFYIIAAVWFICVIIAIAASFLPIVSPDIQAQVKGSLAWVIIVGAIALMLIRRMVDDKNNK